MPSTITLGWLCRGPGSPRGAGAESRWLAARRDEATVVEVLEQSDRAGPSVQNSESPRCWASRVYDRGDYDRRHRIDASHPQGTIRTGTFVSKVDFLRLQCGMPCSKLEVSTVQHGTLSGAGYLHQSWQAQVRKDAGWADLACDLVPTRLTINHERKIDNEKVSAGRSCYLPWPEPDETVAFDCAACRLVQRAGAIELVIWRLCCDEVQTVCLRPPPT